MIDKLFQKIFFYTFLFSLLIAISINTFAQNAMILGKVRDENHSPIELANVAILEDQVGTVTNKEGKYSLYVPSNKQITIVVSYVGYETIKQVVTLKPAQKYIIDFTLTRTTPELPGFEIKEILHQSSYITRIDPKTIAAIPSPSGGIEAIIKTLPGVASNNELSSQYSVRGGNFDENLVYVNDIEIYRPILVRSGQQEGLSFVNSDLVSSILFAAGGFEAKYGDKMSSVLDIQYRKPEKTAGSFQISLLGGSAHVEGIALKNKLSYLIGFRQKSNRYLLKSLPTKGDYRPSFSDLQTFVIFTPKDQWEFNFLGNFSRNQFRLIPQTRETNFGTFNEAYRLTIYFDGQERDRFDTYMGAFSSVYKPHSRLQLKLITSAFATIESETYDIIGQYRLNELEIDPSGASAADTTINLGIGTFFNHARNYLDAQVLAVEHRGNYIHGKNQSQWGLKFQTETVNDYLDEWKMVDSAGYSLPRSYGNAIILQDVIKNNTNLTSFRIASFAQNTWRMNVDSTAMTLIIGIRQNFWNFNEENIIGPRLFYSIKPLRNNHLTYRFSTGYFFQPPFYRELRDLDGSINYNIKAQRSIHFLIGNDFEFKAWKRPFKLTTEAYYKYLSNIIPYEVDNVRIRYYANEQAKGYATGIDIKLNGEFVAGTESWASLSVMQTQEDIVGDSYMEYFNQAGEKIKPGVKDRIAVDSIIVYPGYIPRPTDQRVNFSLFFQDYLPQFPTYKMHLNFLYGSRLPFGPPSYERYKDTLRIPPYLRVDIGFSKQLKNEDDKLPRKNPLSYIKSAWISLEVLNLLQSTNTISYIWIKDVNNRQYAIPNYMTPRQLNLKLSVQW